ncbi:MAG: hypothetical protein ABFC63_06145 [Thermoguttaceae bacterium]
MSLLRQLRLFHRCYLSKPSADRTIYRAIRREGLHRIVELGIGDGRRALRMIEVAQSARSPEQVFYVGIDPFEGGSADSGTGSQGLTLKAAYQRLRATGARIQLLPGNPADSLVRAANSLGKVDLLIVPAELDSPMHARVWLFVPRMLHEQSLVVSRRALDDGNTAVRLMTRSEVDARAAAGVTRRAA